MVSRGRTGGVTPKRVVNILSKEVEKQGQNATARAIGLSLYSLHRYLKGIGEPTQATLEKIAAYSGKSVAWLRGDVDFWLDFPDGATDDDLKHIFMEKHGFSEKEAEKAVEDMSNYYGKSVAYLKKEIPADWLEPDKAYTAVETGMFWDKVKQFKKYVLDQNPPDNIKKIFIEIVEALIEAKAQKSHNRITLKRLKDAPLADLEHEDIKRLENQNKLDKKIDDIFMQEAKS